MSFNLICGLTCGCADPWLITPGSPHGLSSRTDLLHLSSLQFELSNWRGDHEAQSLFSSVADCFLETGPKAQNELCVTETSHIQEHKTLLPVSAEPLIQYYFDMGLHANLG